MSNRQQTTKTQHAAEEFDRAADLAMLTPEEVEAVSGGDAGPAPYNVHSTPAGAQPAFYNL